jgi:hypothetical protein
VLSRRETFAQLLLVLASAGIFLLAFGIRTTWLPDVVPVADSEALRSVWGLQAAVLLKAVENIAGFAAVLVIRPLSWGESSTGCSRRRRTTDLAVAVDPTRGVHSSALQDRPFDLHQS